jgi:hypothetical protein
VRLGCVVRVESIRQDPMTSHWSKSCWRVRPRHPSRELPMAGICVMWNGVSFILGGGAVKVRGVGDPL